MAVVPEVRWGDSGERGRLDNGIGVGLCVGVGDENLLGLILVVEFVVLVGEREGEREGIQRVRKCESCPQDIPPPAHPHPLQLDQDSLLLEVPRLPLMDQQHQDSRRPQDSCLPQPWPSRQQRR